MRNLDSNIPCETKLTAPWYCASLLRHFVSLLNASLRKGHANRSATFSFVAVAPYTSRIMLVLELVPPFLVV